MLKFLFMFSLFSSASPLLSVVLQFQVLMKLSVSVSKKKKENSYINIPAHMHVLQHIQIIIAYVASSPALIIASDHNKA